MVPDGHRQNTSGSSCLQPVKLLFRVFTDDGLQTSAKDRSRSVKALARLVEEDPALLGAVLQHIREGLTSPSIAVRAWAFPSGAMLGRMCVCVCVSMWMHAYACACKLACVRLRVCCVGACARCGGSLMQGGKITSCCACLSC